MRYIATLLALLLATTVAEAQTMPTTRPLTNSLGMRLVPIPAGTFGMGLERTREDAAARFGGAPDWYDGELPRHRVTIARPFLLGDRHVTRGQFAASVRATNHTLAETEGTADAWDGKTFVRKPGVSWRQPDFEQADDHPVVCVNHADAVAFCAWRDGFVFTAPAGSFRPGAWCLYDVAGNA